MQIVETIKQHPYASAGVVFVVGAAIVIYLRDSGGATNASAPAATLDNSSEVAAATQLQQSQLAAGAQEQQQQNQLQASEDTNSTNLSIAQLAQQVQLNGQNVQADTINKQTAAGVSVAGLQYDAENFANQLVATTTQQQQALTADTTNKTTALNAQVAEDQINANVQQETLLANAYSSVAATAATTQQQENYLQYSAAVTEQSNATALQISNNQLTAFEIASHQ